MDNFPLPLPCPHPHPSAQDQWNYSEGHLKNKTNLLQNPNVTLLLQGTKQSFTLSNLISQAHPTCQAGPPCSWESSLTMASHRQNLLAAPWLCRVQVERDVHWGKCCPTCDRNISSLSDKMCDNILAFPTTQHHNRGSLRCENVEISFKLSEIRTQEIQSSCDFLDWKRLFFQL